MHARLPRCPAAYQAGAGAGNERGGEDDDSGDEPDNRTAPS
jgi:hypothetical protein